jgi:hypothetical protein
MGDEWQPQRRPFFMLSGFVIAYSYRSRLEAGMSLGDFALRRFIRLYPMIIFGLRGGRANSDSSISGKPA